MEYIAPILILVAALALCAHAKPEPEPATALRAVFPRSRSSGDVKDARNTNSADDKSKSDVVADSNANANANANANEDATPNKGSGASSGRLFLKKLTLFKNMFSQQQPQIIPIIVANSGTGSYTTPTSTYPTTTTTTSGSIPTATGIVSTSPTSTASTSPTSTASRGDTGERQDEQPADEAAVAIDEQQLQAALAAGAQEYVVTDQEIRGTSDAKASKGPARVNLRRPGGKKGQFVTVRIPARYRQYFKNGQKVMLNTGNRPPKRRVVKRRRVNKNRKRKVGGKRRRVNNK